MRRARRSTNPSREASASLIRTSSLTSISLCRISRALLRFLKRDIKSTMAVSVSKTSILKVLELTLVIICLGLQYHSFAKNDDHEVLLTCGTFGGYLIILIAALMGSCTGQPINKRVDIFFSIVGAALFIASGILSIRYFRNWVFDKEQSDIGTAKGSIAIVNGALFILDAFFSFRGE